MTELSYIKLQFTQDQRAVNESLWLLGEIKDLLTGFLFLQKYKMASGVESVLT